MGGGNKDDGWGLVSERTFLKDLGSWQIGGSDMPRAELLRKYIEVQSNNGREERWWPQAVAYARQLLRKEKGK